MHSNYLPDLSIIGVHIQSEGSRDSAAAQLPSHQILNNRVELPSIYEWFPDQDAPSCSSVSRRASHGSVSSCEQSIYKLSRSSSPINFHFEPSRGQKDPGPKTTGKAPRTKRTNRAQFSRSTNNNGPSIKHTKKDGEAGRRYDHSYQHATLQNQMLLMNPDLPDAAAPGVNNEQIGWTPLKSNNICKDVSEVGVRPLMFNKLNILDSSTQVHRDSSAILQDCQHEREALDDEIRTLLLSGASREEMTDFCLRILEQNFSTKIATSRAQVGARSFQSPLQSPLQFTAPL